jgi:RecA/RadA recombinase
MAPKTKNELSSLKDIFKSVDDLNPDAAILDAATLSTADEWIDTGSYALNAIISGSLYKGIPSGRITGFAGPSMAGKTLIMNKIMANAQKIGYIPVIWDSEVAVDKKSAQGAGMDTARVKYYPVETIEDCRNQMCVFLDNVIKARETNPDLKFIVAIDSLGNLASAKEVRDASAGKDAADVGQRAKACLHPDTLVQTESGMKRIADVNTGDKVLTHLGRYKTVTDKWKTKHSKAIKLTANGKQIVMSKNHKMLVQRNKQLQYVEAQYIKPSDKLVKLSN